MRMREREREFVYYCLERLKIIRQTYSLWGWAKCLCAYENISETNKVETALDEGEAYGENTRVNIKY